MTSSLIILALLWVLLLVGVPIAFSFTAVAMAMLWYIDIPLAAVPIQLISGVDNFILLSVPLFLLMSNILLKGGIGRDLFAAMQSWVGHWKGGLGIATILSCARLPAPLCIWLISRRRYLRHLNPAFDSANYLQLNY